MIDTELRFVVPDLRAIDVTMGEVVACSMWQDERPMRGVAGLVDWRLAGRLSGLARSSFLRGERGEVLLLPGRPKLPFEKVLVLGLGPRTEFGEELARATLARLRTTLAGLRVKRALVEVPGRVAMSASLAAELIAEQATLDDQEWTFIDTEDAEDSTRKRLARRHDARPRPGA